MHGASLALASVDYLYLNGMVMAAAADQRERGTLMSMCDNYYASVWRPPPLATPPYTRLQQMADGWVWT